MARPGSFKIQKLIGQLRHLPSIERDLMLPVTQRQARLLISSSGTTRGLVQITPPFMANVAGDSFGNAKKRGERAVARDIRKVYGGPWNLYERLRQRDYKAAQVFWSIVKKEKDLQRAGEYARIHLGITFQPFDDGAAHHARRDRRGRVTGKRPSLYVWNTRYIKAYITTRQAHVGLLASMLVAPGESRLGPMAGVPEFVRRHSAPWGRVELLTTEQNVTARISAHVPYGGIELQRLFTYALEYRIRAFRRELPNILAAAVKKAGFRA